MNKGMKMIIRERNLLATIFANPRDYRKSIVYLCVSGFCVGLSVVIRLVA